MKYNKYVIMMMVLTLIGCGKNGSNGPQGVQGVQGPAGSSAPGTTTNSQVSPDGSYLLAGNTGGTLVTSLGTWSFSQNTSGGGNGILLNGSEESGGYAVELVIANGGILYAFNNQNNWYEFENGGWTELNANPVASVELLVPANVQALVNAQNAYRSSIGQEPLVNGLTCTLYTTPQTTTQIVGAALTGIPGGGTFSYVGGFNQPNASVSVGLNVLPPALAAVYQTWFIVKCTGQLVVTNNTWHEFTLTSDDGSNMYIDGGLLVANDGLHSVQSASGTKFLQAGLHSFEVDYLQGGGFQELILTEDGAQFNGTTFFH